MGEAAAITDSVAGRVISSYTSTLAALARARARGAPDRVRQLAVGVPDTLTYAPGSSSLAAVRAELQVVASYLPTPTHATHLAGAAATRPPLATSDCLTSRFTWPEASN